MQMRTPVGLSNRSVSPISRAVLTPSNLSKDENLSKLEQQTDWERLYIMMKQEKNELKEENVKLRKESLMLVGQMEEQKFFLMERDSFVNKINELENENRKLRNLLEECHVELGFWTKDKMFRLK